MHNGFAIGDLFDRIAGSYDRLNHLLSLNIDRRWRCRAVSEIPSTIHHPQSTILDVAIGTADLTLEILRQGKAAHVTGLDVSRQMMAIGEQKVAKAGYADKVTFDYGSALEMPYENARFDVVTCAYGVRNFSDLQCGLNEMFRVLKPGGQIVILEFSYPTNPFVRACYDLYFSHILPWVGGLISGNKEAYNYLPASVLHFPKPDAFLTMMKEAGFSDCKQKAYTFGLCRLYIGKK